MTMQITKFLTILILFFLLIILMVVNSYSDTIYWTADKSCVLFVSISIFVFIMRSYHEVSNLSLYSIHFFTFSLLIGGRLWIGLLDSDMNPFEMTFFDNYALNDNASTLLMTYVCGFLLSIEIGMYFSIIKETNFVMQNTILPTFRVKQSPLIVMAVIISPIVIFNLYEQFKLVLSNGYLGLYMDQSDDFGDRFKSIVTTITLIGLGFSIAYGNKNIKLYFIFLFAVVAFSELVFGARGKLITFCLFLIWIKSDFGSNKTSMIKVLFVFMFLGFFLVTVYNLISFRDVEDAGVEGIFSLISKLIYDQGISLMVFDLATKIDSYPIICYIQTFIPGSSFLYNLFNPINSYQVNFGSYLSYSVNPTMFQNGNGLGWSLLADFFVFSGKNYLGFCLLSSVWGWFLIKIEMLARNNALVKSILITIAPSIIFIPRSGLFSVMPLAIYSIVVFFVINSSISHKRVYQ